MENINFFVPISKVDVDKRMVWGYASTPTLDLQDEKVSLDAMKQALPDYMEWANIREMHQPNAIGVTKEAKVDDKGLYIGAKIVDDDAWKKVKEEVYKGFSIGGHRVSKVGDTITQMKMTEISLVDRPANPDCKIEVIKVAAGPVVSKKKLEQRLVSMDRQEVAAIGTLISKLASDESINKEYAADGFSRPAGPTSTKEKPRRLEGDEPNPLEEEMREGEMPEGGWHETLGPEEDGISADGNGGLTSIPATGSRRLKDDIAPSRQPWLANSNYDNDTPQYVPRFEYKGKSANSFEMQKAQLSSILRKGIMSVADLAVIASLLKQVRRSLEKESMLEEDLRDEAFSVRLEQLEGKLIELMADISLEELDELQSGTDRSGDVGQSFGMAPSF